eukprot:scaffold3248_cov112-Cylindrotheca_fusiformis.AAC.7
MGTWRSMCSTKNTVKIGKKGNYVEVDVVIGVILVAPIVPPAKIESKRKAKESETDNNNSVHTTLPLLV